MRIQPFATQLRRILAEYERKRSVFDIHESLFYTPAPSAPFAVPSLFGKPLAAPVGPSAGPHTQLSQNIVSAWLCGGRFMELKTVQVKDDLVIPRPCIDMTDEGYNVEWSQELRLEESAHEYVVAWALLHVLPRLLGWEQAGVASAPGAIFDMSVGYTLEGIRDPRMTRFMDALADASEPLAPIRDTLRRQFPVFADIRIPDAIVNSVTLSTMHGCPPGEIESIARHLLEERGLHVVVKLNPTLLGEERVRDILHDRLGFRDIVLPAPAFAHDLKYWQAVRLIGRLRDVAAARGLTFGVKLSNTLAVQNHAGRLPGSEMYMSGRALYPVTMALYEQLQREFGGTLHVSYSAGADAVNVAEIVGSGALPVTGCTDLLKPGGYGRMRQWLEHLREAMEAQGARSLAEFSERRMENLQAAALQAVCDPRYKKPASSSGLPKVPSPLERWDCIAAPCVQACPVHQDVPEYARLVGQGDYEAALRVILARNPLPGVTGYVCTHVCQARCTRSEYEQSVAIRALKRVAVERATVPAGSVEPLLRGGRVRPGRRAGPTSAQASTTSARVGTTSPSDRDAPSWRVAVIGSGPSGLAAAAFLALNGVSVTIFEARDVPGGMMRLVPPFRLPQDVIDRDIERITALGVDVRLRTPIAGPPEELLHDGFDAVYLATGFQRDAPLRIPGMEGEGVIPALRLLDWARRHCSASQKARATPATGQTWGATGQVRGEASASPGTAGSPLTLGQRAVVIGGGDTAMDAARTALRLTQRPPIVLYRRTRAEMPASAEELEGALAEGVLLEELVSPLHVVRVNGRVAGVRCIRNRLGGAGADGRRQPRAIDGSEFTISCDSVIVAIGQLPELSFLQESAVSRHPAGGLAVDDRTGWTGTPGLYAGGDVVVEPGSIISACADGVRAAQAMCTHLRVPFSPPVSRRTVLPDEDVLEVKKVRARRIPQEKPRQTAPAGAGDFSLVQEVLDDEAARREAQRCVQCAALCDKCVEVCPNRANYTVRLDPVQWRLPVLQCGDEAMAAPPSANGRSRAPAVLVVGTEDFTVVQDRQILHVHDFCNECGNCATFCVHEGRPYVDKPRLFLDAEAFTAEEGNAFYVEGNIVRRRERGSERRLTVLASALLYEDDEVRLRMTPEWKVETFEVKRASGNRKTLRDAAEMLLVYRAATESLPFLMQ